MDPCCSDAYATCQVNNFARPHGKKCYNDPSPLYLDDCSVISNSTILPRYCQVLREREPKTTDMFLSMTTESYRMFQCCDPKELIESDLVNSGWAGCFEDEHNRSNLVGCPIGYMIWMVLGVVIPLILCCLLVCCCSYIFQKLNSKAISESSPNDNLALSRPSAPCDIALSSASGSSTRFLNEHPPSYAEVMGTSA